MKIRDVKYIVLSIFLCSIVAALAACGGPTQSGTVSISSTAALSTDTPSTSTPSASPTTSATAASGPLHIAGVTIAVNPSALTSLGCNSTTNVTFTAAIASDQNGNGGAVSYSWNVGGSNVSSGSVTFAPGDTSKTVTYTLSNAAIIYNNPANMTATLTVSTPNAITSAPIRPAGTCTFTGPFTVAGIGASVSPASLTGIACGTTITITYTATVNIAPNSNGGTVNFDAVFGSAHRSASVAFGPGTTTQVKSFTSTVTLARGTPPTAVFFTSTSPNVVNSSAVRPTGSCS